MWGSGAGACQSQLRVKQRSAFLSSDCSSWILHSKRPKHIYPACSAVTQSSPSHTHTFIYKKPLIILCSCSSHRLFLLHVVFFVLLVCSLLFIILFLSLLNRRFPSLFFPSLYIFFQISRSLPALGWFFWADTETVRFNPQTDGLIRRQMLLQLRSRAWWETSTSQTLLQLSLLSSFLDVFF